MSDIRARFEEIWPVPAGIAWSMNIGAYVCNDAIRITQELINKCTEWDARLETFTRCQETTAIHVSLIDEIVKSLQWYVDEDEINEGDEENCYWVDGKHAAQALCDQAKQIMEQKK